MALSQQLKVDWDRDDVLEDVSGLLIQASGQIRLASPEDSISAPKGIISQCSITMLNDNFAYGLLASGIDYYQSPMTFAIIADTFSESTPVTIFTGVIKGPTESGLTYKDVNTIAFDCRGREELIVNQRTSTGLATFRNQHDAGVTESEIIEQWLLDAGLSGADYELDTGLFVIPWAWLDDESPLEDIWQLAASCGGRFYCDGEGIFRYENMHRWLDTTHASSAETLTPDDYQQLKLRYEDGELFQSVTINVSAREVLGESVIWEADEVYQVPPGTTKTVTALFQQPAYSISAVTYAPVSAGGQDLSSNVSVSTTSSAQRVDIAITNSHATKTALMRNFQIAGRAVHGGPSSEVKVASAAAFWSSRQGRTRRIGNNQYIQTVAQAEALANFLLARHETPRMFYTMRGLLGKATRLPGQRITIDDDNVMASPRDAFIISVNWRYSASGYTQDIECVDATGLFPYQDTTPGYFKVGTNKLGAADALKGRVFY